MAGVIFPPDIGDIIFSDIPFPIANYGLVETPGKCFSKTVLAAGFDKRSPNFDSIVSAI